MPAVSSRGRGRRTINEINMVPFIDVMLVLLIIFMVTAPMITPSMVDLPSVGKAAKQPDQVIQIVVQKDDSLEMLNDSKTQNHGQVAQCIQRAWHRCQADCHHGHCGSHDLATASWQCRYTCRHQC